MTQVNLSLKEIYKAVCPKCQAKLVKLVAEKLHQDAVKKSLESTDA